jgi:hypothetical protein
LFSTESDTVIDEHFRRSLGQDYLALFPAPAQATSDSKKSPLLPTKALAPNNVTLTGLSGMHSSSLNNNNNNNTWSYKI